MDVIERLDEPARFELGAPEHRRQHRHARAGEDGVRLHHLVVEPEARGSRPVRRRHARLGVAIAYLVALALWAAAFRAVRVEGIALAALLPMALHLAWQVTALKPDEGADALAKFRSNRFAGLLMFLACFVVGTA